MLLHTTDFLYLAFKLVVVFWLGIDQKQLKQLFFSQPIRELMRRAAHDVLHFTWVDPIHCQKKFTVVKKLINFIEHDPTVHRVFDLIIKFLEHLFFFLSVGVWGFFLRLMHKTYFFIEDSIELFLHVGRIFKNPVFVSALPLDKIIVFLFLVFFFLISVIFEVKFFILILHDVCLCFAFVRLLSFLGLMFDRRKLVF